MTDAGEDRSSRQEAARSASATLAVDGFVTALSAASTAFAIYPPSHPQARQSLRELLHGFRDVCEGLGLLRSRQSESEPHEGELTLLVVEEDLVVQGQPWHRESPVARGLCKLFRRAAVERLTLAPAASALEFEQVVLGLAGRQRLENTRHVTVGHLDLLPGEQGAESTTQVTSLERAVDELHSALRVLGPISELETEQQHMVRVDRAAWRLVEAALNQDRSFVLNRSLVEATDPFWRHGIQTGLLSLVLARQLGIEGSMLTDVVLAAVLHDIGRLQLSDVHQGEVTTPLWRHTVIGAERLAHNSRLPPVCALVAYEHHLFWDGSGGYPSPGRSPSLVSQIVAVADAYDVAHQAAADLAPVRRRQAAGECLQRQNGLQPDLVELFAAQLA